MRSRRLAPLLAALVSASTFVALSAPASHGDLARVGSAPTAPHTNVAAVYDLFGAAAADTTTLATVTSDLEDEGYKVDRYTDKTEGAGSHGTATLANFAAMAKQASVIVINGHGYDPTSEVQSCVDGKGFLGYEDPGAATTPSIPTPTTAKTLTQVCSELDQPILQIEWYPSLAAGKAARKKYVAQGYKNQWFAGPFLASTTIDLRLGDEPGLDEAGNPRPDFYGRRWGLFMTASGIAHFFGDKQLDIVDLMACQTMALAPAFDARTFFGHARTACTNKEAHDEPKLFDRLAGRSGVEFRTTAAAFEGGGFDDQYFKMAESSKPVVLSPAVTDVSPGEGGGVAGTATPVILNFDAKMEKTAPSKVVTASGCDASIANAQWRGDTAFDFDLKVPKIQPGKTMTLTVHHEAATSGSGYPHELDGNQDPGAAGESGVAPNGDDYVWHLSCAPSTKFKMVYTGTYEYTSTQTPHGSPPETESGSYTWTQTQILAVSAASPYNSTYDSTTTLDASGTSLLDGTGVHVSCTIQTPSGYGWVRKRTGTKYKDGTPISFQWVINSVPLPGGQGVTGTSGTNGASGCQSDDGFTESYGFPEPLPRGQEAATDDAQSQVFDDALFGLISFPANKLPQTKHFDIDASGTEDIVTASLTLHATLTFSKL